MNEFEIEKKEELTVPESSEEKTSEQTAPESESPAEASAVEPADDAETTTSEDKPAEIPAAEPAAPVEEKPLWNYAIQAEEDRKKAKKKGAVGALVYAIIMTCLFLFCFAVLAVLLITGYGSDNGKGNGKNDPSQVVIDTSNLVELVESVQGSVVTVKVSTAAGTGFGSGFVYSDEGYIITNYHVIDNAKRIIVVCHDGSTHEAELIDGDELSDVAVIRVKNLDVPSLPVGDSDNLRVGEDVIAIGTPVDTEYAGTVTKGIISGVKRKVRVYDTSGYLSKTMEMIQTDTVLNHGNSGGPLINMRGEVIGINTMKYYASDAGDTLYFSIPINDVAEIADDIIADGKYSGNKGSASQGVQLGVQGTDAVKGVQINIDQNTSVTPEVDGALIIAVNEGYCAYGKLEPFDIITGIDGVKVTHFEALRAELYKHKVGDKVILEVWRDGKTIEVELEL